MAYSTEEEEGSNIYLIENAGVNKVNGKLVSFEIMIYEVLLKFSFMK